MISLIVLHPKTADSHFNSAYCHVFRPDGRIIPMKGTLVPKK